MGELSSHPRGQVPGVFGQFLAVLGGGFRVVLGRFWGVFRGLLYVYTPKIYPTRYDSHTRLSTQEYSRVQPCTAVCVRTGHSCTLSWQLYMLLYPTAAVYSRVQLFCTRTGVLYPAALLYRAGSHTRLSTQEYSRVLLCVHSCVHTAVSANFVIIEYSEFSPIWS